MATKQQIGCYSQNLEQEEPPVITLPENATYQEKILFLGEQQMRRELIGPARNSIINFVVSQVKTFIQQNELTVNKSQFVSFLDAWLVFLHQSHSIQDNANQKFSEWLTKLAPLLSGDNKKAWNKGVIQGFIKEKNMTPLRRNVAVKYEEDEVSVISLNLEGKLMCALPSKDLRPKWKTCEKISEIFPSSKLFMISGQSDLPEEERISTNQIVSYDTLVNKNIISPEDIQ
jgi:hypothetical protein